MVAQQIAQRSFVLLRPERAGRVDQDAAGTQQPAGRDQHLALQPAVVRHPLLVPVPQRGGVTQVDQALSGALGVKQDPVEPAGDELVRVLGGVTGGGGEPDMELPRHRTQLVQSGLDAVVRPQARVVADKRGDMRRLPTGRRTQVNDRLSRFRLEGKRGHKAGDVLDVGMTTGEELRRRQDPLLAPEEVAVGTPAERVKGESELGDRSVDRGGTQR